jgi:hypothetical protein
VKKSGFLSLFLGEEVSILHWLFNAKLAERDDPSTPAPAAHTDATVTVEFLSFLSIVSVSLDRIQ